MNLDPEAIARIRELQRPGRPDVLARVLQQFSEGAPRQCAELRSAVTAGDHPKATFVSHTLKSSAAAVGATELATTLREFEVLSRAGRGPEDPGALEQLQLQVDEAVRAALALLKGAS